MERTETDGGPNADDRDRVAVSLVHNHLPRLDDHDAIDYDREAGEIAPGERFHEFASVLEAIQFETDEKRLQLC